MSTKSGIILTEGEEIVVELQTEIENATGTGILATIIRALVKFVNIITGVKYQSWFVITNKRVVEIQSKTVCWVINSDKAIKYVLPSSVTELGYMKEKACCCCCDEFDLYYASENSISYIALEGVVKDEQEAQAIVDAFYRVIQGK